MDVTALKTSQFAFTTEAHRSITAKNAKIAKNIAKGIAKGIAQLTHRTIAPSHGETADSADGRRFHRTVAIRSARVSRAMFPPCVVTIAGGDARGTTGRMPSW